VKVGRSRAYALLGEKLARQILADSYDAPAFAAIRRTARKHKPKILRARRSRTDCRLIP
jgi:hypothetical protein